ncbi:arsenical pump-driving ATPase [Acidiferrobacter sp.]|uniref:arsenical pump-driving ATPase n=1 Tax=Acidiferrobacter sp. TaxID=1872107 RepID=UPI002638DE38|nr:arsenical pump-driving ATPase [Acidiferrobacter sp.]
MTFLASPPRFLFFTGKGGVGKTSIACASAVALAESGLRVLLVSTDPASNVGQVFGQAIGNRVVPIAAVRALSALEIDPQDAARQYRDRIVGPVREILPAPVVKGIEEQLSGACTTEIAAFDEFTALLHDPALAAAYDHVVFDTAPTGHTLRLLRLPGAWSGFLEAGRGDASCLGPLAGLAKQRAQYKAATDILADPQRTRLILVARPQQTSLREVARTHKELASMGLRGQHLVINGILSRGETGEDRLAGAIYEREQSLLAALPEALKALPTDRIALKPDNLVGLEALQGLFTDSRLPVVPPRESPEPLRASGLAPLIDKIAAGGPGLVMLMGKGGVGKTTLAAALAVALAERGLSVHLTTTDPAAHLAETLNGSVAHLTVSRIDPRQETERYRRHILATRAAALDAEGRMVLEEDLRSPCTEEIAVFQAFSRIVREADRQFVVMDTAPTGHTLLLLDATGAYHREMTRQTGGPEGRAPTPMVRLQDSQHTKVLLVTLAETTPVLEAAGLQADLRRAGIEPWAWIVNQSLAATCTRSPLLQKRALAEHSRIEAIAAQHARRYAVVPLAEAEPAGAKALRALVAPGESTAQAAPCP